MSGTPIFDQVSEAYANCKSGWQKQAVGTLIADLEKSIADVKCTKKKCESKCNAIEAGKLEAIVIAKALLERL